MVKAIIELSNYILVLNLLLYTIIGFVLLPKEDEERSSFFWCYRMYLYSLIILQEALCCYQPGMI